ncbi:unnamed protein product [Durusdinium trenchii]|uniref:Dimethylpropiothetin dethiomethylase n=1 Tax=Durusdinium trenchii TaxID=1381693 RepID=A0ABP0HIT4_9DINO
MHVILRVVVGDSRLPALALAQTSSVLLLPEDNRLDLLEFEVQRLRAHQTLGLKRGCRDPRRDPETEGFEPNAADQLNAADPTWQCVAAHASQADVRGDASPPPAVETAAEAAEETMTEEDFEAELLKAHEDLLNAMRKQENKSAIVKHPSLGVVRLDYDYPPAPGDSDCPGTLAQQCQRWKPRHGRESRKLWLRRLLPLRSGAFTEMVERRFADAIKHLEARGVSAITGDCGFMMAFQVLARKIAKKPIFMSSMVQCPIIAASLDPDDDVLILTANDKSLKPQKEILLTSCGFDVTQDRFHIHGCQDVPGFEAVALGQKVPLETVQPGIVKLVQEILEQKPQIRAILLECTELPPYADALRYFTGLPVWDAITAADFYVTAFQDFPRFGLQDWQREWDGSQEDYELGMNLTKDEMELVVNKAKETREKKSEAQEGKEQQKASRRIRRQQAPILGVIRLDYNYPPAKGDIDCPGSYEYDVLFRVVPGFTFAMAMTGQMSPDVEQEFIDAVKWLEGRGVAGITGDCGFMMAFQPLASQIASVPVFMSSMMQCPMISVAFDKYDKVLILTANDESLKPQKETLLRQCGFNVDDQRLGWVGGNN